MPKLYTVYRKGTDELVAFELPARQCAELMGITYKSFMSRASQARTGELKYAWEIYDADNLQEEEN